MSFEDSIEIKRDTDAKAIPLGLSVVLRGGETVCLLSRQDGAFTVQRADGQVVRLAYENADALGLSAPAEEVKPTPLSVTGSVEEKTVWDVLRTCFDPEVPVNIVELGLVYGVQILPFSGGGCSVTVTMTMTAPGCEMAEDIRLDAENKVKALPGVAEVTVEIVFDPPWTPERMTEAARLQLGMY
jgi:probable FeS assembly SUF system protein SufT